MAVLAFRRGRRFSPSTPTVSRTRISIKSRLSRFTSEVLSCSILSTLWYEARRSPRKTTFAGDIQSTLSTIPSWECSGNDPGDGSDVLRLSEEQLSGSTSGDTSLELYLLFTWMLDWLPDIESPRGQQFFGKDTHLFYPLCSHFDASIIFVLIHWRYANLFALCADTLFEDVTHYDLIVTSYHRQTDRQTGWFSRVAICN